MAHNFCTLFDKNYLTRGLALHSSLLEHARPFKLWILCMDQETYTILAKLKLTNVILIKLSDFEDKQLLAVKSTRTPEEYCWTCTPSLPLYIFEKFPKVKMISYLDADLYFYSSPKPIFDEMEKKSIMIIPHRFADRKKLKEKMNGTFNVGMLSFRRDTEGIKCLKWWRDQCLDWCFYRFEEGKIGDQKYLEQFPRLFKNICILNHVGAGVAVWNISQYRVWRNDKIIYIDGAPLIFYHFADLEIYSPLPFLLPSPLTNYGEISTNRNLIYNQYFQTIYRITKKVRGYYSDFSFGFTPKPVGKYIKEAIIEKIVYLKRIPKLLREFGSTENVTAF